MPARLNPPETVKRLAQRLEDAGFETWFVGGGIRDALLGQEHLDWDLATAATPAEVQKLFKRTVPVGIEFGTVGVFDSDNVMHEVTTFRRDVGSDGRHAVVEFGASLDEDLARRDYTINAIAYSPKRGEIRDPFGGQKDIESGIIRAVGNPDDRMREDRLRALRAIRFAARFGFKIDPATWQAIVESAPDLGRLSAERVKQEIEKTMDQVPLPSRAFAMWAKSGSFATLIPSLAGVTQAQLMPLDHLRRSLLPRRPQRRITRIAALFSLAAPPFATEAQRAAEVKRQLDHRPFDVRQILKALRFSNAEADWIGTMVGKWHTLGARMTEAMLEPDGPDDATLRRWASTTGRTRLAPLFRLADAFWWASRQAGDPAPDPARVAAVYRRAIRIAYNDPIEVSDLAVDGDDLQQLGVTGPALGATLRKLLEVVINDPGRNTRDQLLAVVKSETKP
ncbi:MAG TPA: CCA tRNA nucleotidyltransferase [Gemmatimonadaceae bacterium]|nr:CCA tRNA nucleotidyltransferase [Gemmatimonadaceae bacterium]